MYNAIAGMKINILTMTGLPSEADPSRWSLSRLYSVCIPSELFQWPVKHHHSMQFKIAFY